MPQLTRVGQLMATASLLVINIALSVPVILSATTYSVNEGEINQIPLATDVPCTFTIVSTGDYAQFSIIDNIVTLSPQTYVPAGDNDRVVSIRATDITNIASFTVFSVTFNLLDVAAPANTAQATIGGSPIEGNFLTATPGTWTGISVVVTGQWYRGASPIADAISPVYRLTEADINSNVKYRETATNPGGVTTQDSTATTAVQSGLIARFAMDAAVNQSSTNQRWTSLGIGEIYPIDRLSDTAGGIGLGLGKGNGTVPYRGGQVTGTSISWAPNTKPLYPKFMRGQSNMTGGTGAMQFEVPVGVEIIVRLACGAGAAAGTNEWSIRDSSNNEITSSIASGMAADTVLCADGQVCAASDWYATDKGYKFTPTTTSIIIRRKATGSLYSCTLRCVEICYPSFALNTSSSNLLNNEVYVDPALGNDITGDGTIGNPFKNLPGDEGATGVVPGFLTTNGSKVLIKRGTRLRAATFSGGRDRHIRTLRHGAAGASVITYGAYGSGANPIIDGSELLTGWSVPSGPEVFNNPNVANIQKKAVTGVVTPARQLIDGEESMYPAQWPSPSNPAEWYRAYPGNDGYITLNASQYGTQVSIIGTNQYRIVNDSGVNNIKDRYGPDNVLLTGFKVRVRAGANRLLEYTITHHVPATGEIQFTTDGNALLGPTGSGDFPFAICYHPYDLRKEGQYAYSLDLSTAYGHFNTATRGIIRLDYGFYPVHNYIVLDGIDIERFHIAAFNDAPQSSGSVQRVGIEVKNSAWRSICGADSIGANLGTGRVQSALVSDIKFQNIVVEDSQRQGALQPVTITPNNTINGLRQSQAGRTSLYISSAGVKASDINVSDNESVHGNGIAIYQSAKDVDVIGFLAMNHSIPLSLQQDYLKDAQGNITGPVTLSRNVRLINGVATGRRRYTGAAWDTTIYTVQQAADETDSLYEGLILGMYPISLGASSNTTWGNCTGMVIRNCIISNLLATKLNGITFENVLLWKEQGGGQGFNNIGEFNAKNPLSVTNVVVDPAGSWQGVITEQMQQFLTKQGAAATYAPRTLGTATQPWYVPAWGTSFTLADRDPTITTSKVRRGTRPGFDFGCIINTPPGCAPLNSLPALGDNALFNINKGVVSFVSTAVPGVYSLVIRMTVTHTNLSGGTTRDVAITITVV